MSLNKYAYGRYQVIDRELHKKDWVKTKELKEKIEVEMGLPISTRQLQKDIIAMKQDTLLGWNAPIVYDQISKAYKYSDKKFSIKKFDLKEEEVAALKFYAASIYQYREYGLFKDFSNALQKVVEAVNIKSQIGMSNSRLVVQTDNVTLWKGIEFLTSLAKAIDKRNKVSFDYKKFEDIKSKKRFFSPYLLKEYQRRWYVIGKQDGMKSVTTFALDRISNLEILNDTFTKDPNFNHEKYFQFSFGIARPEIKPIKIVLLFKPKQGGYVKSLPIHPTQKILSDNKYGLKIQIRVILSIELYQYLLSQAGTVKIISPLNLALEVKEIHKQAAK